MTIDLARVWTKLGKIGKWWAGSSRGYCDTPGCAFQMGDLLGVGGDVFFYGGEDGLVRG